MISKTYRKDEARAQTIESVYAETGKVVPDEAPIWNEYRTRVYSPARFRARGPMTLVCAFGDTKDAAIASFNAVKSKLDGMRAEKQATIGRELVDGALETGNQQVDDAYAHVLTRFNDCLVARDALVHVSGKAIEHFNAIFAGNKYFMDAWKRDENISLRALLETNDFETVRAILDSTWQFQDERTGRLPQIIRAGEALVYYSSDGTLWALHRLFQYTQQSGDTDLLRQKLPMVEHFFRASLGFVQCGLLPSGGIVDPHYRWETWEDTPFTPRDGYPVEIELLWLTVLEEFSDLIEDAQLTGEMRSTLQQGRKTFEQFYGDSYLFDSLGYDWTPRRHLTPNGYLAFDLQFPLPPSLARAMVELGRDQLAGRRGVRSLAPRDWAEVFPPAFLDDPRSHTGKNMASFGIFNYHRGIEWQWFNSTFVCGELLYGDVGARVPALYRQSGRRGAPRCRDRRTERALRRARPARSGFPGMEYGRTDRECASVRRCGRRCPSQNDQGGALDTGGMALLDCSVAGWATFGSTSATRRRPQSPTALNFIPGPARARDIRSPLAFGSTTTGRYGRPILNGRPVSDGDWIYDQDPSGGSKRRARVSVPLSGDIDLQDNHWIRKQRSAVPHAVNRTAATTLRR